MPALITDIIPKQGFEVCRDLIGAILLVELANQKVLQGASFPETIEGQITVESLIPTDSINPVSINILIDTATYDNQTQSTARGNTKYFIDIHTSGTSSQDSAFRRDKFVGMIGYIFRSAQYRQLGLTYGQQLIGGTYVETFATQDPHKKEDTDYTSFARIQICVMVLESSAEWAGVPLEVNNTKVSLELSNKGYIFVFEN